MWQGYFRRISKEEIKAEIKARQKDLKNFEDPKFIKKHIKAIKNSLKEEIKRLKHDLKCIVFTFEEV